MYNYTRVLNRWNSLSQDSLGACSVNAFKRHMDKIQLNKMVSSWTHGPPHPTGCCTSMSVKEADVTIVQYG